MQLKRQLTIDARRAYSKPAYCQRRPLMVYSTLWAYETFLL